MFAAKLIFLAGAVALAAAAASPAPVQPASSSTASVLDGPIDALKANWRRLPKGEEIAAVYPKRARDSGVSGKVRLRCRVIPTGDITDCAVVSESPTDYGFGAAAMALTPFFHLRSAEYGPNASIELPLSFNIR